MYRNISIYKSSVKGSNNRLDVNRKIENDYVDECDIHVC